MGIMLAATGGELTVTRTTATYTYGKFEVKLPEGQEKHTADNRIVDGYIYDPRRRGVLRGKFDIGFVRADVTIDLDAGTTDLESVVDAAQKRTTGDTFFEQDITGVGLGLTRPEIDFNVGDVVPVQIWGKQLELPVTSIDWITDDENRAGYKVHVGGQLISDAEALRAHNDPIRNAVLSEKRQRLRELKSITGEVDKAVKDSAAALELGKSAVATASQKKDEVAKALEDTEKAQKALEGLNTEFSKIKKVNDELQNEAIDLNNAAIRMLGRAQVSQTRAIEALDKASKEHDSAIKKLDEATRLNQNTIHRVNQLQLRMIAADNEWTVEDKYIKIENKILDSAPTITAKGNWKGQLSMFISYRTASAYIQTYDVDQNKRVWHEGRTLRHLDSTTVFYIVREDNT